MAYLPSFLTDQIWVNNVLTSVTLPVGPTSYYIDNPAAATPNLVVSYPGTYAIYLQASNGCADYNGTNAGVGIAGARADGSD